MRIRMFSLSFIALALIIPIFALATPMTYAPAVKVAAPAVVNVYILRQTSTRNKVSSYFKNFNRLKPILRNRVVLGSGVIMNKQGYILTNSHVIRDRNKVLVALSDGRAIVAQIIGSDPETDLAVLRIQLKNLPVINIGNSDKLQVGDIVLAIGNPFGLGRTVTQGIISALGRTAVGLSNIENFIQTDVALNPGSSGGALINTDGQLIGINTGIYTRSGGYQGVSFAIPVNAAENVLKQIIKNGTVKRGWLGIEVATLDLIKAHRLGSKQTLGVIVDKVLANSPAANIIKKGDIITAINGRKVRNANGFMGYIAHKKPDSEVRLTVYRKDAKQEIGIKLGSRRSTDNLWQEAEVKGKKYRYPDDRI